MVLFFLILIFLYKALDITEKSNHFFSSKVDNLVSINNIKKIFIEDIAQSNEVVILSDKDGNSILLIETSNMYHNVFYKYVTYFISKKKNLIRIESLNKFDHTNITDDFFKSAFIDRLIDNIELFEISKLKDNENAFSVIFKKEKEALNMFGCLKF